MAYQFLGSDTTDSPMLSGMRTTFPHPRMYSPGATRQDIFGGSQPDVSGIMGNLYFNEPSHLEQPYQQEHEPRFQYEWNQQTPQEPKKEYFQQDESKATTPLDEYEIVEEKKPVSAYWTLALFIFLFVAISYWLKASDKFFQTFLFKESKPEYWHFAILAIILTVIFVGVTYIIGVDLKVFETL